MKEWLRARSPQDVAAFYGPKYRKDGHRAFQAGWPAREEVLRFLERHSPPFGEKTAFLDAGCGNGEFLDYVSRQRRLSHVTGIDVTPEAVHLASSILAEKGSVFECTIEEAGDRFPMHFDRVTCLGAIEHTMDPSRSFESLMKTLRPGGILLITVPLEFSGCLTHIEQEENGVTNERFGTFDEWRGIFGVPESAFTIFGSGESLDAAFIYTKEK